MSAIVVQIYDYNQSGRHCPCEYSNSINLSAQAVTILGNSNLLEKGIFNRVRTTLLAAIALL